MIQHYLFPPTSEAQGVPSIPAASLLGTTCQTFSQDVRCASFSRVRHSRANSEKQKNNEKSKRNKTREANANVKIEGTSEAFSSAHFTRPSIRNRRAR